MIVKNESRVVRRALLSAIPHIDYWVICDTGSTDATEDIIRETLREIPGELHSVPWVDFGYNRTQVLDLARKKSDYFLILDADVTFHVKAPFKHKLSADGYELRYEGDLDYVNVRLVSACLDWYYVGVTHEQIRSRQPSVCAPLPEVSLIDFHDGGSRAGKFERDLRLLTESVSRDPTNARDTFYLAQTYKDLGRPAEAGHWYERRIAIEGWEEERWYAMYQLARMRQASGVEWPEVLASYLDAIRYRASRAEPLYEIVRHCRRAGDYEVGFRYAAQWGVDGPYPSDKLFVERPVYNYLLAFEYGLCAMATGRDAEALRAFSHVKKASSLPEFVLATTNEALQAIPAPAKTVTLKICR